MDSKAALRSRAEAQRAEGWHQLARPERGSAIGQTRARREDVTQRIVTESGYLDSTLPTMTAPSPTTSPAGAAWPTG